MPGRDAEIDTILSDVLNHEWNLERDTGDSWPAAIADLERQYPQWADIFRAYDEHWEETLVGSKEDTVKILRQLKEQGVPLLALSNWSAQMFPYAEARFDWLKLFDGVVVSGRVGMVKPNRDIFDYLMTTYGRQTDDLFFIDDNEPNVVAARSYGIHTHQFRDAATLRAELITEGLLKSAQSATR
jgi:2-haloacid dehalogenase